MAAGGWEDLADADVLVICAATALTDNVSRSVYLDENAAIVDAIAARLDGWAGVVVMVTNPVDPLSARLALALGDRRRVDRLHAQRHAAAADLDRGVAWTCRLRASRRGCWASTATAPCRSSAACGWTASR